MLEILRSNNPVLLNFVEVLLRDGGIASVLADQNMSVLEGSIGIMPRRILVSSDDWSRARRILEDAGLGDLVNTDEAP